MIIMVYVLHHLEEPVEFLINLKKYTKTDGPLIIIERNIDKDRDQHPHFMSKKQILDTIQKTDFKLIRTESFLPKDTIYILKLRN